jgi:6-phosphogluconolactonase
MDGSEGPRASRVRRFAEQFIQRGGCPVLFHDERLTSFEAEHLAAGLELTRKKKKKRLDAIAAAAILNSFLEHKRKTQERKAVHVCRVKTMEELTEQTLQCFMDSANQAIEKRERFWAAISGGQTPLPFFRKLSEPAVSSRLEWNKIHLFWVDERAVPPDSPASNYGQADRAFLQKVPFPSENVHRIQTEDRTLQQAAEDYQETLRSTMTLQQPGQVPVFDLIILGMGADGHIASLFPDSPALFEMEKLTCAVFRADIDYNRITLTIPVLLAARRLMILVSGQEKAHTLKTVLSKEPDPILYPVHALWPVLDNVTWIIDEAAGAEL